MNTSPPGRIPYPARRDARYVALIVFTASLFSFLDRQILVILVDPIRRDLHVSDTGMSLLYGFAFVTLYSLIGLPIGRLVDQQQRRLVLAAGVAVWSVMTIACGVAVGFGTLFCARVGVGVGEACLTPAVCSLLADSFEPSTRGRALSSYLIGVYFGIGLSMVVGGLLYDVLAHSALPLIGGLAPWRQIFVMIGSPGLAVAVLVLTIKEPARQDLAPAAAELRDSGHRPSLLPYLQLNIGTISAGLTAHATIGFVSYGLMGWAPTVLMREFHQSRGVVGLTLGLISVVGGVSGALAGAVLCDRWTTAGVTAAKFRVCACGAGLCAAGLVLLASATVPWTAFAAFSLCLIAVPFAAASGQAMVQELFPNDFRGQGSALLLLLIGLFGAGCGPLVVALLSDRFFHAQGLSIAIVLAGLPATGVVILLYHYGRDRYEALRRRTLIGAGSSHLEVSDVRSNTTHLSP